MYESPAAAIRNHHDRSGFRQHIYHLTVLGSGVPHGFRRLNPGVGGAGPSGRSRESHFHPFQHQIPGSPLSLHRHSPQHSLAHLQLGPSCLLLRGPLRTLGFMIIQSHSHLRSLASSYPCHKWRHIHKSHRLEVDIFGGSYSVECTLQILFFF